MKSNSSVIVVIALLVAGAAPIALNGGGGEPFTSTWTGQALNGATGCAAYSFASETTLGFGRRADDTLCFGTTTGDANIDFWSASGLVYMRFNKAPSLALPHVALHSDVDSGFVVSDGTTPFTWVDEGVAKMTLGTQSSRTYLCFGAWNTSTVPCFTSASNDFVMKYSDGSAFAGELDIAAGSFLAKNGTAASPSYVWNNDNTGFYRAGADQMGVSINGTLVGYLADYQSSSQSVKAETGYYLKFDAISDPAAAGVTGDCDATNESGRIIYDYTNHKLMLCNDVSTTRTDWDKTAVLN